MKYVLKQLCGEFLCGNQTMTMVGKRRCGLAAGVEGEVEDKVVKAEAPKASEGRKPVRDGRYGHPQGTVATPEREED